MASGSRSIRWWPAMLLVSLYGALLFYTWSGELLNRQRAVQDTAGATVLTALLLGVWFFFLSRFTLRTKLRGFAAVALAALIGIGLFKFRGLSGDLVPMFDWRWGARGAVASDDRVPAAQLAGAGFGQFLGPSRNAMLPDAQLVTDWAANPPKERWRIAVGEGWSAFAISGDNAVTQEQRQEGETIVCYDLDDGSERWRYSDTTRFESGVTGNGPRATPTIDLGGVFAVGVTGVLTSLDLATGAKRWSVPFLAENDGRRPQWGVATSPLVLDSLVIVSAGGTGNRSLVAYHRESGERVWAGGSAKSGYSSPALMEIAGRPQVLIFNHAELASHDPKTGTVLWTFPWEPTVQFVAQPLLLPEDKLLLSTGYGVGSRLLSVRADSAGKFEIEQEWRSPRMKAKFTNLVYREGYVFGLDDGVLVCLDPATGKRKWKRGRYGHGQILLAGDVLIVLSERGEIVLVRATSEGHEELARLDALPGKTWNNIALAGSLLVVRNDKEAVCYELDLANR